MKVAHLIFALNVGGAESMLVDIVNEQSLLAEVNLFIINDSYDSTLLEQISPRVRVHHLGRRAGSWSPLPLLRLNQALHRFGPHVVHCHNSKAESLLLPTFKRCLTVHDVGFPKASFERYKALFAISGVVAEDVKRRSDRTAQVIYNGVPVNQIREKKQPAPAASAFRLVQISRLVHEKKGQHLLLEALHRLNQQADTPSFTLDFIGEGPSRSYLEELTDRLNLRPYVSFLGQKDRQYVCQHLADYDLLVQPSLYEGFGLTVAEAMAARVPVLVSAIDGPLEIIQSGRYGWAFTAGNSQSCADQLLQIVQEYGCPSFLRRLEEARQHVQQQFNIRETARQYLQSYSQF